MFTTQLTTRDPLSDVSIRFANTLENYIASQLFPVRVVPKNIGKFYQYTKDNFRAENLNAPSGARAPTISYSGFTTNYTCKEIAVNGLVLGRDARDFDVAMADLDTDAAMHNMDKIMLDIEIASCALLSSTSNFPTSLSTTLTDNVNRWDNAGGDPIADVNTGKQAVMDLSGKRPNSIAMSKKAYNLLIQNPSIVDRVKYTSINGVVQTSAIAQLFDVQNIYLADCKKNTANEGAADSLSDIWADYAVLFYKDPSPGLKSVSFGQMFVANSFYTKTIDMPELGRSLGAHYIESGMEYVLSPLAVESSSSSKFAAGYLVANIY